jgi:predicted ATPase
LAELERFVAAAGVSKQVLLLEGPAGIGKTAVWQETVARSRSCGCRVLVARPVEAEAKFGLAALCDLLEGFVDPVLPVLVAPQRHALEVALARAEGRTDSRTLRVAVLAVFRHLAAAAPVVVAIDDVQWLDRSSAEVLAFALRRLEGERVIVVATHRQEVRRPPRPRVQLTELFTRERVVLLPVGPLNTDELRRLLRLKAGTNLPRSALERLHTASGGNPLYALEIARALPQARGV